MPLVFNRDSLACVIDASSPLEGNSHKYLISRGAHTWCRLWCRVWCGVVAVISCKGVQYSCEKRTQHAVNSCTYCFSSLCQVGIRFTFPTSFFLHHHPAIFLYSIPYLNHLREFEDTYVINSQSYVFLLFLSI